MQRSINREIIFPQTCEEVWRALTDSESLTEWMFPNNFVAQVGHQFAFEVPANPLAKFAGIVVHCEILKCIPPTDLVFTWVAGDVNTRTTYKLEATEEGTKVFFEQSGFEQDQAYKGAEYGWTNMHGKLTTLLSGRSL